MRLATAKDELVPQRDPRVRENEAYLTVLLLSRVITRLGTLPDVHPGVIENMFASDLAFLQDLYRAINQEGSHRRPSPARRARTSSRSRWQVTAWGDRDVPDDQLYEEVGYVA
jgi:hypothetical protein